MTTDGFNAAVFSTEWGIASAGNPVTSFEAGLMTYDCARCDLVGSHLAWQQQPMHPLADPTHPCPHPFEYVVPYRTHLPSAERIAVKRQYWALWLSSDRLPRPEPRWLTLLPVRSEADWEEMVSLRDEVERAFPGYSTSIARRLVEQIRHRKWHLDAEWYLAVVDGYVVGEVGLLTFDTPAGRVGRLQDVDVAPSSQGKGLGRELLWAVCGEAERLGLDGICLRADADDWPEDWYLRFGFVRVGTWTTFKLLRA